MPIQDLVGTSWQGEAELWLDPAGDQADRCACSLHVEPGAVRWTWSHQGQPHRGGLALRDGGADFADTFHSPAPMPCASVPGSRALLEVVGTYLAGEEAWGWRTALALRPDGALLLQMTNVTPWGEEGRAVRMICRRGAG